MTHMKRNITLGNYCLINALLIDNDIDIRLKAALKPLSKMDCQTFIESLEKSGSGLNYESLVNIALHEPRTFEVIRICFITGLKLYICFTRAKRAESNSQGYF